MSIEDEGEKVGDEVAGEPVDRAAGGALDDEEMRIWKLEGYDDLPFTMSVPVVGRHLGVSKSTAYNLCKVGTIHARHFGGRMSVTRRELFRLLHGPDSPTTAT